jgi:hypothetical protein
MAYSLDAVNALSRGGALAGSPIDIGIEPLISTVLPFLGASLTSSKR